MIKYIIIILLLCSTCNSQNIPMGFTGQTGFAQRTTHKVFYLSSAGNDNNTGLDTSHTWKTFYRLKYETILPGDTIRIKGNDTIHGSTSIYMKNSVDSSKRLVVTTYRTGKATIISDSGYSHCLEIAYNKILKVKVTNINFVGFYNPLTQHPANDNSIGLNIVNLNYSSDVINSDSMYIYIDSCKFTKFGNSGLFIGHIPAWSDKVVIKRKGYLRVLNCEAFNLGENGIVFSGVKRWNSQIYNNSVTGIRGKYGTKYTFGIYLIYCSRFLVERNYVDSVGKYDSLGSCGIYAGICDSVTYRKNEVRNMYLRTNGQEGTGLYFDGECNYGVAEYNYVGNCDGEAVHFSMPNYCVFRYNIVIQDSTRTSLDIGDSKKMFVYNNLFYQKSPIKYDKRYWKSVIIDIARGTSFDSIYIYNNIFISDSARTILYDSIYFPTHSIISHNIYYSIVNDSAKVGRVNIAYPLGFRFRMWTTLANWADSSGYEKTGGVYTFYNQNPLVNNLAARYAKINQFYLDTLTAFKVSNSSVAINNGLTGYNNIIKLFADTATVDFYGTALPYNNKDIGVYEKP